jgi:hypothetical protein
VNEVQVLMVDLFSRSAATIFGLFLFIVTTVSLLRTIVVPRALTSLISDALSRSVTGTARFIAYRRKTYVKQDGVLAWSGPMIIVIQLVAWLILYFISYGLWIYGIGGVDFTNAFREAGSSLFTLGFADTTNFGPTILAFMAAATGPIVIALLIGFLPTIYGAYIDREVNISLLGVSGGQPSWGPELLARLTLNDQLSDIPERMNIWTKWFGDLRLTHTTYPVLVHIRSASPYRHWVIASIATLDAAAMQLALTKTLPRAECAQVIIHGTQTLESLYAALFVRKKVLKKLPIVGRFLGAPTPRSNTLAEIRGYNRGTVAVEQAATGDSARSFSADAIRLMSQGEKSGTSISKDDFTDAVNMLKRADYPVEVDLDTAWTQFSITRARYEYVAYQLAYTLDVVPAPWSGERKDKFDTLWPTSAVDIYEDKLKDDTPGKETS